MELQTQSPAGILKAIGNGLARVLLEVRAGQRLETKMIELQVEVRAGIDSHLRKDKLELVPPSQSEIRSSFGADANPVDPFWGGQGSIGLNGDFESGSVKGIEQRLIELKEGLAAGANGKGTCGRGIRPEAPGAPGHLLSGEGSPARAIGSHEVRITDGTEGARPILFAARPEIAPCETDEYGGAAGVDTFPLKGIVHLFDRVFHGAPAG